MDLSYFTNLLQDYSLHTIAPKFDLTLHRIEKALKEIGDPHQKLPPTIHVAGTNGKCSTIAFMRAILESSGLHVHVYTSPHLLRVNERIVLAGEEISDHEFIALIDELAPVAKKYGLSWFEFLTLIAFQAFHQTPANVLLLETGLGGEFDATNVISSPIASMITPISYDHLEYLGPTLKDIATAKAGIIKPNAPVYTTAQDQAVIDILQQKASVLKSTLLREQQDWTIEQEDNTWNLVLGTERLSLPYPQRLRGCHQVQNAALAIAALKDQKIFHISDAAIHQGLMSAHCPGRLMQLEHKGLLAEGSEIWFDGAHNQASAHAVAQFFQKRQGPPLYIICGLLQSKDAKAFLAELSPIAQEFIFVPIPSHPLCYAPEVLMNMVQRGRCADTLEAALTLLAQERQTQPTSVLICGSFYLARAAFEIFI